MKSNNILESENLCMLTPESGRMNITDDGTVCTYYCHASETAVYCNSDLECSSLGANYCCSELI